MKLKINFLFYLASLLAGLALGYLFSRETISNTPSPDKTTDSNQIQGIEHLIRENASLALEADALVEEMAALTQTISKLEIQLNKYVKSGDKKIDAKQTQDERYLKKKLKEYTTMLDLTPHQQNQVEGWLRERVFIEESVKSILTDAQLQIYEKHLAHEKNVLAARGANYELNKYPVTINLSEDIKIGLLPFADFPRLYKKEYTPYVVHHFMHKKEIYKKLRSKRLGYGFCPEQLSGFIAEARANECQTPVGFRISWGWFVLG